MKRVRIRDVGNGGWAVEHKVWGLFWYHMLYTHDLEVAVWYAKRLA